MTVLHCVHVTHNTNMSRYNNRGIRRNIGHISFTFTYWCFNLSPFSYLVDLEGLFDIVKEILVYRLVMGRDTFESSSIHACSLMLECRFIPMQPESHGRLPNIVQTAMKEHWSLKEVLIRLPQRDKILGTFRGNWKSRSAVYDFRYLQWYFFPAFLSSYCSTHRLELRRAQERRRSSYSNKCICLLLAPYLVSEWSFIYCEERPSEIWPLAEKCISI